MTEGMSADVARGTVERLREAYTDPDYRMDGGFDVYEWLEGVLDVQRTYGSDGELRRVSLLTGFGGPNVWVDFDSGEWATVRVYWAGDDATAEAHVPELAAEVMEALDTWRIQRG